VDTYLWIAAWVAAACAFGAALLKLTQPRERILEAGLRWAEGFTDGQVKLIGVAELLGGLGLVVPPLLGTAEILTPIAAACLAVLWSGAVVAHIRRRELKEFVPAAVLVALAAFVAYGRFGDWSF
jgi:VIT1/CCC1 family predicted Fe2+/Mn2+ transporter